MVAKVISGKNIRGILQYNEQKVREEKAEYLLAHKFGAESDTLSFGQKLNRFERLLARNRRVKTNALHISLNFDVRENLAKEQLISIANQYMDRIGFGEQPYLVYQHHDAAHPHLHIVTTNIREDGKRIDLHNIGRNQSEVARKEIEQLYGLVPAESKKHAPKEILLPTNLEKARYGKLETKRAIADIVRQVTRTYKYTSLAELNAVLRHFNVQADRGSERSQMFQKKGLAYSLLDEQGTKVGVPIKASAIYGKPTLPYLEKQFPLNQLLRRPHSQRIKTTIEQVLATPNPPDRESFSRALARANIAVVFRNTSEGRTYGITFVDHQTKTVFNGSDLGKAYAANAILERLSPTSQEEKAAVAKPVTRESRTADAQTQSIPNSFSQPKESAGGGNWVFAKMTKELVSARAPEDTDPQLSLKKRKRKKKKRMSL
jgi:hypothetical protein